MKDVEKTIGNLIEKQSTAFISSVDEEGFPNTKAMLPPRKREGIKTFYFTTNTSSMRSRNRVRTYVRISYAGFCLKSFISDRYSKANYE